MFPNHFFQFLILNSFLFQCCLQTHVPLMLQFCHLFNFFPLRFSIVPFACHLFHKCLLFTLYFIKLLVNHINQWVNLLVAWPFDKILHLLFKFPNKVLRLSLDTKFRMFLTYSLNLEFEISNILIIKPSINLKLNLHINIFHHINKLNHRCSQFLKFLIILNTCLVPTIIFTFIIVIIRNQWFLVLLSLVKAYLLNCLLSEAWTFIHRIATIGGEFSCCVLLLKGRSWSEGSFCLRVGEVLGLDGWSSHGFVDGAVQWSLVAFFDWVCFLFQMLDSAH